MNRAIIAIHLLLLLFIPLCTGSEDVVYPPIIYHYIAATTCLSWAPFPSIHQRKGIDFDQAINYVTFLCKYILGVQGGTIMFEPSRLHHSMRMDG